MKREDELKGRYRTNGARVWLAVTLRVVNVSMYSSCSKDHDKNLVVRAQIQVELHRTSSKNWSIVSKEGRQGHRTMRKNAA